LLTGLAGFLTAPRRLIQAADAPAPVTNHESRITRFAPVVPGYRMQFPRDEGSHPDFRLEWWYVTGWLEDQNRKPLGFQLTFFRARPELKHDNPSAFAPRQIMIAHAALSDPAQGRLIHAQRAARAGFGLAGADLERVRVWIDDWRLEQEGRMYRARIAAQEFSFDLLFDAVQPPLEQGQDGFSRKGPAPESASYYYSLPHLKVSGAIVHRGTRKPVGGAAWLDHEWSSQYMEKDATGWDWIGINFDDGGALMAFRMRDKQGRHFWAGGSLRLPDGRLKVFAPDEVRFNPGRTWRSARTGTNYPVSWLVKAGDLDVSIEPLFDDQEHDTRVSTGTIYWEGAVRANLGGWPAGRGYLELTGYWRRPNL
jgi:predicted secreted hydrolase